MLQNQLIFNSRLHIVITTICRLQPEIDWLDTEANSSPVSSQLLYKQRLQREILVKWTNRVFVVFCLNLKTIKEKRFNLRSSNTRLKKKLPVGGDEDYCCRRHPKSFHPDSEPGSVNLHPNYWRLCFKKFWIGKILRRNFGECKKI